MCCCKSAWADGPYYGTDPIPHYNPALDPANFHNPRVEISPQGPDHAERVARMERAHERAVSNERSEG